MKNSELLSKIIDTLEKEHINLYHDVSKEEIQAYISNFSDIDQWDNITFDREMLKLFAKFKDAHTNYYVQSGCLDKKIIFVQNNIYLKDNEDFKEVEFVDKLTANEFIEQISSMICYETKEYLTHRIRNVINNQYYYQMIGLCQNDGSINFVVKNNRKLETINVKKISGEEYRKLMHSKSEKNYSFEIINDNVVLIRYKRCWEDKDYPFAEFVEDIEEKILEKHITQYVLDLRNNGGGNSSVIKPLAELVERMNLKGVVLINSGVFSSGRWAVADFKSKFNAPLIGEPTGGAAASYGLNENLQIEDKYFCVAKRYWDFESVFGYKGSIQPDIYVPTTLDDIKNKKDSQLLTALSYLSNQKE